MKTLIVYDSRFGNTEKIAMAIGKALSGEVRVVRSKEVNFDEIHSTDLLIAGSPTWGGRPSTEMREFLNRIPKNALNNIKVASFDTRDTSMLTKVFGKAAPRIAACLKVPWRKERLSELRSGQKELLSVNKSTKRKYSNI